MSNELRKSKELVKIFYETGITSEQAIRCAIKHCQEQIQECRYLTQKSAIVQDGAMYYPSDRIIYWRKIAAYLNGETAKKVSLISSA